MNRVAFCVYLFVVTIFTSSVSYADWYDVTTVYADKARVGIGDSVLYSWGVPRNVEYGVSVFVIPHSAWYGSARQGVQEGYGYRGRQDSGMSGNSAYGKIKGYYVDDDFLDMDDYPYINVRAYNVLSVGMERFGKSNGIRIGNSLDAGGKGNLLSISLESLASSPPANVVGLIGEDNKVIVELCFYDKELFDNDVDIECVYRGFDTTFVAR